MIYLEVYIKTVNDENISGIQDAILDLWWKINFR